MKKFVLLFAYGLCLIGATLLLVAANVPLGQQPTFMVWFWSGALIGLTGFGIGVKLEGEVWPELQAWLAPFFQRLNVARRLWAWATEQDEKENALHGRILAP